MKKLMSLVAVAVTTVALVGCGNKPKLPADTVAAAYVDLEKTVGNLVDIAEMVVDELPKEMREDAEKELGEVKKAIKENLSGFDLEWATISLSSDLSSTMPDFAVVIKCDYNARNKTGKTLAELLEAVSDRKENKFGVDVLRFDYARDILPSEIRFKVPVPYGACVDSEYVIIASHERMLEKFISLYRDGKGETSDAFDDLTDLGSDAIARIQVADVGTLVDLTGEREEIEKAFDAKGGCDDEDLCDMFLDIGNVTLDLNVSEDVLGAELVVDAGCSELAKVVESAFNLVVFANRVCCDAGIVGVKTVLGRIVAQELQDGAPVLARMVRESVECGRSGSKASLKIELDTDDLVEELVPALAK